MTEYTTWQPQKSPSFQSLVTLVEQATSRPVEELGTFEEIEGKVRNLVAQFEAEVLGSVLERFDVDADRIEIDGRRFRWKLRCEQEYHTAAGPVRIERNLYVAESGSSRAVCPLELRAGIVEGTWTPMAAKIMAQTVASVPPREAASLIAAFGGMQPSSSSLDRLPKRLSRVWEEKREENEGELRCRETIPVEAATMVVSLDGVQTPMKDCGRTEKRNREDKRPQGPAGFKEVGCGTVSFYDEEGNRLRTTRYARMPQQGKRDLKRQLLEEARSALEIRPDLRVEFLSDGAQDHWNFLEELKQELHLYDEDVTSAIDAFHVLERLKTAVDAYHGEKTPKSKGTFEELRAALLEEEEGANTVLRALRYRRDKSRGSRRKTIASVIDYITRYRHLMPYAHLREQNLPIGTGVVEAACKTLVSERMKRSGMRWGHEGGQAVLTVRSLIQSDRWDCGWELIARHYRSEVRFAA